MDTAQDQERVQIEAWDRCADYLRRGAEGTPLVLSSRDAALILAHEATMRGHVLAAAQAMEEQAEETLRTIEEVIEENEQAIARLTGENEGLRAEAAALRAERDAALSRLAAEPSEQERGCVVVELGVRVR